MQRLQEHFGERIVITSRNHKADVATFLEKSQMILNEFYTESQKDDVEKEKLQMIETVEKLIESDIKLQPVNNTSYPKSNNICDINSALAYMSESLRILLRTIMSGQEIDLKIAAIGHCITQAARPRVIVTPLAFGLGIQVHNHFGSRWSNDIVPVSYTHLTLPTKA